MFLYFFTAGVIFILGTVVGSFLNVVIFRLKNGEPIALATSKCPDCGHRLGLSDLIPIFSFLFLKARCRYCQKKISWQYPIVELTTGLLFVLIFIFKNGFVLISGFDFDVFFSLAFYFFWTAFLIVVFVYDLKHYLILDRVMLPVTVLTLVFALAEGRNNLFWCLFGALVFGLPLLLIYLISKGKWLGGGDVKLAFVLGLITGFPNVLVTFFLTFTLGALVAVFLMARGRKKMKDRLPLGTFMAAAAFASFFLAPAMVEWYRGLIGF